MMMQEVQEISVKGLLINLVLIGIFIALLFLFPDKLSFIPVFYLILMVGYWCYGMVKATYNGKRWTK